MGLEPKSRHSLRFQVPDEAPYAEVEVSKVEKDSDRIINSIQQLNNQQTELVAAHGKLITQSQESAQRLDALVDLVTALRAQLERHEQERLARKPLGPLARGMLAAAMVASVGAFVGTATLLFQVRSSGAQLLATTEAAGKRPAGSAAAPAGEPTGSAREGTAARAGGEPLGAAPDGRGRSGAGEGKPKEPAASERATVPALVGKRFEEAQKDAAELGIALEPLADRHRLRPSTRIGWQSVAAGAPLASGSVIKVSRRPPESDE